MRDQPRQSAGLRAGEHLVVHHLVQADDALTSFHYERCYFMVCGQVLKTASLPSSLCRCALAGLGDDECGEVVVYCQDCLREAARHNAEWVSGE